MNIDITKHIAKHMFYIIKAIYLFILPTEVRVRPYTKTGYQSTAIHRDSLSKPDVQ